MIDAEGFRLNVGIIVANSEGELMWAKRVRQSAWQFPQGGVEPGETPEDAAFRELWEELGLERQHVELLAETPEWLRYRLPRKFLRSGRIPLCIGQRQKWFLLRMIGPESAVKFDCGVKAEFDRIRWVNFWQPLRDVVPFKRSVYRAALKEFAPVLGIKPQRRRYPPRVG